MFHILPWELPVKVNTLCEPVTRLAIDITFPCGCVSTPTAPIKLYVQNRMCIIAFTHTIFTKIIMHIFVYAI